ncbi:TetR/AcrR family transcriptional regulator [Arthrobacter sp. ZGTC131]|uniref:TetR/AcrR family transcriptional regulator n=1 Tax=Arthrobacter sp. ZGTC131 TaxID=2058898 RepID=UPI001C673A9D|nr:helix-turn-helix domain-containing protein [Arthrobacter sp. ZGTC131]
MPGGRKRAFDDQVALDTAMELFWRQGYEGTSIADLTLALGINPPSLYAAFGSKRELFERTLDRYLRTDRPGRGGHGAAECSPGGVGPPEGAG